MFALHLSEIGQILSPGFSKIISMTEMGCLRCPTERKVEYKSNKWINTFLIPIRDLLWRSRLVIFEPGWLHQKEGIILSWCLHFRCPHSWLTIRGQPSEKDLLQANTSDALTAINLDYNSIDCSTHVNRGYNFQIYNFQMIIGHCGKSWKTIAQTWKSQNKFPNMWQYFLQFQNRVCKNKLRQQYWTERYKCEVARMIWRKVPDQTVQPAMEYPIVIYASRTHSLLRLAQILFTPKGFIYTPISFLCILL